MTTRSTVMKQMDHYLTDGFLDVSSFKSDSLRKTKSVGSGSLKVVTCHHCQLEPILSCRKKPLGCPFCFGPTDTVVACFFERPEVIEITFHFGLAPNLIEMHDDCDAEAKRNGN